MTWFFTILYTLTAIVIFVGFIYNYLRRRQSYYDLKPNILLCKYPIYFITAEQSLFYFGNYYNSIPEYLFEHGYMVRVVSKNRILKSLPKESSYYLFMSEEIFNQLLKLDLPQQVFKDSRIILLSNYDLNSQIKEENNKFILEHKLKVDEVATDSFQESLVDQLFLFLHRIMRKESQSSPHSLGLVKNDIRLKQKILNHFVELAEIEYYNSNQQL